MKKHENGKCRRTVGQCSHQKTFDYEELDNFYESSVSATGDEIKQNFSRRKFIKFSRKKVLSFWCQFSRNHKAQSIDDEEKFLHLLQCIIAASRTDEIAKSYTPTVLNYSEVIYSFKKMLDHEEMVLEYYVREML